MTSAMQLKLRVKRETADSLSTLKKDTCVIKDKNDKKPGAHNTEKARYFKPREKSGQSFPSPYLPPVFAGLIFLLFFSLVPTNV